MKDLPFPEGNNTLPVVMADPADGCDSEKYKTRILNSAVFVLRGGCSFSTKAIMAQKLGAKVLVVVNSDVDKSMRLKAIPEESENVKIPVISVSRKIQHFVSKHAELYSNNKLYVNFFPMDVISDYEKKNPFN